MIIQSLTGVGRQATWVCAPGAGLGPDRHEPRVRARRMIVRARVLAETDTARLERWLESAATASSVAEVLGDPS